MNTIVMNMILYFLLNIDTSKSVCYHTNSRSSRFEVCNSSSVLTLY